MPYGNFSVPELLKVIENEDFLEGQTFLMGSYYFDYTNLLFVDMTEHAQMNKQREITPIGNGDLFKYDMHLILLQLCYLGVTFHDDGTCNWDDSELYSPADPGLATN